eukprot:9475870-Pyramimonas_sp.AAC.1
MFEQKFRPETKPLWFESSPAGTRRESSKQQNSSQHFAIGVLEAQRPGVPDVPEDPLSVVRLRALGDEHPQKL